MLEEMGAFFERRVDGYDEHMLEQIEGAKAFYPFTARQLPMEAGRRVLDLGCGTGLELEHYLVLNPGAKVTGIDLCRGMLERLVQKLRGYEIELIEGSYFEEDLGQERYDAAVSVESLHHFTKEQKTALYGKVHRALKRGGSLILTDYFAPDDEKEQLYRETLEQLKAAQGIAEDANCHYDTPLTTAHETEALLAAGFAKVEHLARWGDTHTLKATRER